MNKEKIEIIKQDIINSFENVNNINQLNETKSKFMGANGTISELSSELRNIPNELKKEYGMLINEVRNLFSNAYDTKRKKLELEVINKKLAEEKIDITLPSNHLRKGSKHPLNVVIEEIEDLFYSMGYDVVSGHEIESDLYNFELLNLPKNHPARDAQDTFYITNEMLLQTHTSPMQARMMQLKGGKEPIRMICPGKTYRRDDDATHSHQFTQIEGLVIDKNISLADLKGTLEVLLKKLFGENISVRFRASYFPFTEPSYEVDISCFKCGQKGCNLCKNTGWIEILGSGMVHPNVLKMNGYDPNIYSGFAFGIGIERTTMLKYGIPDIRYFYTNNLKFLDLFSRKDV